MTVDQLLASLAERRIIIALKDGELRYRAPQGALTPELRAAIVTHRPVIMQRLRWGQYGAMMNGATRCEYCDPGNWVDEPPKDGRIRTHCGKCRKFIGYRPAGR